MQLTRAFVDRYLASHRMCSEAIYNVAGQIPLIRFHFRERIVTAEVGHFDSELKVSPQAYRYVQRSDAQAAALELHVKRLDGQPIRGDAPESHQRRVPLKMMVDAVILRIAGSVKRRPHRTIQQCTGRSQP